MFYKFSYIEKVIDSCKTMAHIDTCINWLKNLFNKKEIPDFEFHLLLCSVKIKLVDLHNSNCSK